MAEQTWVDVSDLPGVLQDLAPDIGVEAAMAILDRWAGKWLYIPRSLRPGHPLLDIGEEVARTIVQKWSGQRLKIQKGKRLRHKLLLVRIAAEPCKETAYLAQKYRVSRYWITTLKNRIAAQN